MKALTHKIIEILDKEFPNPAPPLRHRSNFEMLLAVILSAQCTDERVNRITPNLFPKNTACTPEHILALGLEKVREIIFSCGYHNQKSAAILGCAKALQGRPAGKEVPSDFKDLTALPGVGAKTAQVIQVQCFGMDAFPVDTHIHRVCNRLGLASSGTNRDKTERQVKAAIPKKYWSRLHLQLIFHGRKTCTVHRPKCEVCPLRGVCEWYTSLPKTEK